MSGRSTPSETATADTDYDADVFDRPSDEAFQAAEAPERRGNDGDDDNDNDEDAALAPADGPAAAFDATDGVRLPPTRAMPPQCIVFDFRSGAIPPGVELIGDHGLVTLDDGSTVLTLGPLGHLRIRLPDTFAGNQRGGRINSYTLTMDIRAPAIPDEGVSLLQTGFPDFHSTNEAVLSAIGTVGAFNEFGDAPMFKVGKWNRVAITLGGNFGTVEHTQRRLTTYVNGQKCVEISEPMWGYGKDTRFSINPRGFMLFASSDYRQMPGGIQVKYVRFSAACDPAEKVQSENRVDSVFSQYAASIAAAGAELRNSLSLSELMKKPHPIWLDGAFLSAFGDPYLEGTGLGSGSHFQVLTVVHHVWSLMVDEQRAWLSQQLPSAGPASLEHVRMTMERSLPLMRRYALAQRGPAQLVAFLSLKGKALASLQAGESIFLPSGFVHPKEGPNEALLELTRLDGDDLWDVMIVNVGPQGLAFHPCDAYPPKIKYKTAVRLRNIPGKRLTDDAWWAHVLAVRLFPQRTTSAASLYDHLLLYLTRGAWADVASAASADDVTPYRTLPRSGAVMYRLFLDAMFVQLRRGGLSAMQVKFVLFNLRRQFIKLMVHDVTVMPSITDSDRVILKIANDQLARRAASLSGIGALPLELLEHVRDDCADLEALVASKPSAPSDNTTPPSPLDLTATADSQSQFHVFPAMERLLRKEDTDGLVGPRVAVPRFVPIDFLQIPAKVENFEGALTALRFADKLCTLISVQSHCVKNGTFLKCAMLQRVFTQVVPVPAGPGAARACVWQDTPMRYGVQLDVMILLQRLVEHFASSALGLRATRSFDAVRIVLTGAIAAIADCVMRKSATDHPSEVCVALAAGGFGVGMGCFASQSETIEVTAPEVAVARTAVMDYFARAAHKHTVFNWEASMAPERSLAAVVRHVCDALAFPDDLVAYMCDPHHLLIKNFPEWACYRDVCFYWKFFMNTEAFPEPAAYTQRHAELQWGFDPKAGEFVVKAFGERLSASASAHRWASAAAPSRYTAPVRIFSEDDLLHIHSFSCFEKSLTQKDTELLLSFLTVPYMRIPLTLNFFATADRINALRDRELRALLDAVVFEPSRYLTMDSNFAPTLVPSEDPALVASPYGVLLNELHRSPRGLLDTVIELVRQARKLDVGTVYSSTVGVMLFVIRLVQRIESAVALLVQIANGTHPSITTPLRDVKLDAVTLEILVDGQARLEALLRSGANSVQAMLEAWLAECYHKMEQASQNPNEIDEDFDNLTGSDDASDDDNTRDDDPETRARQRVQLEEKKSGGSSKVDKNTRVACRLYAHLVLLHRNLTPDQLNLRTVSTLLSAFQFLQTRHTWNHLLLEIPETEVFEAMENQRRNVIFWMQNVASNSERNHVLECVVRVTAATGVRVAQPGDIIRQWDHVLGERCVGRFTLAAQSGRVRTICSLAEFNEVLQQFPKCCFDFYATWCGPCSAMAPAVALMAQQVPGVAFFKVDVDALPAVSELCNVSAMPTFKVYNEGRCVSTVVGADTRKLREAVQAVNNIIVSSLSEEGLAPEARGSALVSDRVGMGRGVDPSDIREEEVNLQTFVLQLKSNHLMALDEGVQADADVQEVFQVRASMQSAVLETAKFRTWYRLVGRFHDIQYWGAPDPQTALQVNDREYEPGALGRHEGWIVPLFEPVRLTYFNDPMNPIEFVMPEKELPAGSAVGYLVALHPKRGGTWKEIFVFRQFGVVHVYDVISYGRRYYRSLSYTTDARFTLRELQPCTGHRKTPWPSWCRHGAGDPTADLDPGISAVILRDASARGNISGTAEQFIPRRFLFGLIPCALVETHRFWQDAGDNLVGYPVDPDATHHLAVTFCENRAHADLPCMPSDCIAHVRRVLSAHPAVERVGRAADEAPAAKEETSAAGVDPEVQLVNLMYAKEGTALHSMARSLARIENLSHILVWTTDIIDASAPPPHELRIYRVELPRLKLTFAPRQGPDGVERLYSIDHVDLFVTNDRNPLVNHLIRGIPHSLLLSTVNGEITVLVPSISPVRPFIQSSPFSSELVLDRSDCKWRGALASPYYLYPVHVSMSFLQAPTLASALYLLLLRLSFRAYDDVVRLVDTIATDTDFKDQPEELQIFKALGRLNGDAHPNAHAARLKITGVMADSPVTPPWMLDVETCKFVIKIAHVSSACQLSIHERLLLLDECEALERKQEVIGEIVREHGVKQVAEMLKSFFDEEAALELTFAEKKKIDRFFDVIAKKVYATLRRRIRTEEVLAVIKRIVQGFQLPEFLVCLWKNDKAYIDAFTSGAPHAPVLLPRPARESRWQLAHLPAVFSATPSQWELVTLHDALSRGVSGHVAIDVITALMSGATDTSGGRTGFSFLFFYGLLTGTVKFRLGNCQNGHTFASLCLPLLNDYGDHLLASILHVLSWNPELCPTLPAFKDTRKNKQGRISCAVEDGDSESPLAELMCHLVPQLQEMQARLHRPPTPLKPTPFPPQRSLVDVPHRGGFHAPGETNFPHGEYRLPTDVCGNNPVLLNTAKDRLELPHDAEADAFAASPLAPAEFEVCVVHAPNSRRVSEQLPFDVSKHHNATSHIAQQMLDRFADEMRDFARQNNEASVPMVVGLHDEAAVAETVRDPAPLLAKLLALERRLKTLRDADTVRVARLIDELVTAASSISNAPDDGSDIDEAALRRRVVFELRRRCGLESTMWIEYLVGALISAADDVEYTKLNPFLTAEACARCREMTVMLLLHANRVGHANRALLELRGVVELLQNDCRTDAKMRASLLQKADALAAVLAVKRHYISADPVSRRRFFDPRFLVFEFTWNLVLRKSQVTMIRAFMDALRNGRSTVWQMIMGAGKTTVVGPLLALLLATGKQLVMQVVPPALLEFSRGVMRATFGSIIKKRVYTLTYDRSTEVDPMLFRKLLTARSTAGVVITNPTSIKSLQLKFVEYLDMIADPTRPRTTELEEHAAELAKVLELFRTGVLMMDEVDLILHPLKSELNFPIGAKEPLDFSPLRWQLPIHLLDAIFFSRRGRMSVEFRDSVLAAKILGRIHVVINSGYKARALQASPHVVLLDVAFYHAQLKPLLAQWTLLWMERHSFSGINAEETLAYITASGTHAEQLRERVSAHVSHRNKQILNLAHDWLRSYLPHALTKINRVTFGIMTKADARRALRLTPNMPRSRTMLAIPFVGKDVPSDASEFAHPDIIIGLTILAYRYEGLRFSDFKEIVASLRETVLKEHGPWHERKANQRYEQWVREAGGAVRGQMNYAAPQALPGIADECAEHSEGKSVISLKLLKQSSREQIWQLFTLLRRLPDTIHWYLNEFVFPTHMRFQNVKISASGQDLGGDMLFPRRVGFSGTPSDLLPVELGRCNYEPGSDGLVIDTLTNPKIVTHQIVEPTWSPSSLLRCIAQENRFHALIDTGALVTGMSNVEVARFLLDAGLSGKEGVVFLDESDRKMILVRATRRVLKLEECGIPLEKRFAFYDQIHTTGMDIRHTPNAVAVLTLGKDMTFRDYAQGAFRMRGINKGQTIHLFITPEVRELMLRELRVAAGSSIASTGDAAVLVEVASWLVVNSMGSERLQFNQLCLQNVANVYRKNGFSNLLKGHARFRVAADDIREDHCLGPSLAMFHEPVAFELEACVPQPRLFSETIDALVGDKMGTFIADDAERAIVEDVRSKVVGLVESCQERAFNQDMVREQEEEKEKMKEVVEEKELEITQFKDQQYARDQEEPTPWLFAALSDSGDIRDADPPTFYAAGEFRLFARQPLRFPKNIQVSSNYFDRRWSGHRRVKNVIMMMDWVPDRAELKRAAHPAACAPPAHDLTRTFKLLTDATDERVGDEEHDSLSLAAVQQLLTTAFERHFSDETVAELVAPGQHLSFVRAAALMAGPTMREEQEGRIAVCLSLIEAETIRRIMHVKCGDELIEGARTDLCLRAVCCENYLMDASTRYTPPPPYQRDVAWNALRFLDCETHYKDAETHFLLKGLQLNAVFERRLFFEQIIGCKRRNQKNWQKTPVNRLFVLDNEYVLLHLRTLALRVKELVHARELLPFDAFQKFDFSRLGTLSPANIFAAFRWLGLDATHEDVLDYVAMASACGEGRVSYAEWLEMMRDTRGVGTATDDGDDHAHGGSGMGGMGSRATSSVEFMMDSPSTNLDQQARFAGTIEDRLPPADEEVFDTILSRREAQREEDARLQAERLKAEERRFASLMKQFKRDAAKARGCFENPSVTAGVLHFDFTSGHLPDDVTSTGYTYFEPASDGKKQLRADVESMVVLPLGSYELPEWWGPLLHDFSITLSVTMTCDVLPGGGGAPLLQLARHYPGGLVVSALPDGAVGIAELRREELFVDEKGTWQWESNSGWVDFESDHNAALEKEFRRDPRTSCPITVFGAGVIIVNFSTMMQRNTTTNGERAVRRIQNSSGKRLRPNQPALVTLSVNVAARIITTFIDGRPSVVHFVPPEIPEPAFAIDTEHAVFVFGHSDKHAVVGGCVRWVALQSPALSEGEVAALHEQHRALTDWSCPGCTFLNKEVRIDCEVCGTIRSS